MKRILRFAALLATLALPSAPVSATMVVTDPGSYAHFINDLKESQTQTMELIKQAENLMAMKKEVARYQREMERMFKQTGKFSIDFEKILEDINSGRGGNYGGRVKVYVEDVRDIDSNLDGFSVGLLTKDYEWMNSNQTVSGMQRFYKKTIRDARVKQAAVKNRIEELDELAEDIGKSHNLKESAAVRNRMLHGIERNTASMIALLAKQQELEALSKYTGYSEALKALFEREKKKSAAKGKRFSDSPADRLRARGMVPWAEKTP